jgi:enoyl-CoA hydratase
LSSELLVDAADGVLRLTLHRPEVLNALSDTLADELAARLEAAGADDEVRVVVLTGTGDAFCAGADIGAGAGGDDAVERFDVSALDRASRIVRAITVLDKPVVAAVNGVAAGVGCSIALAADLPVAARSASFVLAFTRIGLMPDGGSTALVAASVGRARAMRMALLAEPLSAQAAWSAGLLAEVVADDELTGVVDELAGRLAVGPPLAYAATKKAVNAATLAGLEAALDRERSGQSVLLRTADAAEGMRAFGEKRRPRFSGS